MYLFVQGPHGVVVFAQLHRRPEPKASDGNLVFPRKRYPLGTGLNIRVRVVLQGSQLADKQQGRGKRFGRRHTHDNRIPFLEKLGGGLETLVLAGEG